jgi:hypothetical protein
MLRSYSLTKKDHAMTTSMTPSKTIARQQFVDAFLALQNIDQATEPEAYQEQFRTIVNMLVTEGISENEPFNFISELLDPDYGIGHQVLEPYAEEQKTFCSLLKTGNGQDPRTIMPKIVALAAVLNGDDSSVEFSTIPEADINTIFTISNVAETFYSDSKLHIMRDHEAIAQAVSSTVQTSLSIHYAEGGEAAMQSALEDIADKWVLRRL